MRFNIFRDILFGMWNLFKMNYHPQLIMMINKASLMGTFSINLLTPTLLSYIIYDYLDHLYIQWWLILNFLIFVVRIFLMRKLTNASNDKKDLNPIFYRIVMLISLSSLLQGYALWYMSLYVPDTHLFFVSSVTVALISGSIATLGSVYPAFVSFVVLNSIPIIFIFSSKDEPIFYIFSVAVFTFMFVTLRSGYNISSSLRENLELKESFEIRVKESILELEEKNSRLNESLHNFQDLQDTSMLMIAFHDENGVMISINEAAAKIYGYEDKEEVVGMNIKEFLAKESIPLVMHKLKEENSEPYELIMKKKDGTEFPTLLSARYTVLNSKRVRMTTIMDLSDVKEKEQLFHKQARLAQMGEMISMIAHQWRQPLNAISATSLAINLKAKLGKLENNYAIEMTDNISEYAQHLSDTIDDFRNFFKPNKEKSETSFHELIESVIKIIETTIFHHNITLIQEIECRDKFVSYTNELKQVILNLFKNAEDALVDNKIEKPFIKVRTFKRDSKLVFEISDNAGGISTEIIEKVFNPYFSTKKKKDGTGLGLYMSKLIVEEHCNGELSVHNSHEGAIFTISLDIPAKC